MSLVAHRRSSHVLAVLFLSLCLACGLLLLGGAWLAWNGQCGLAWRAALACAASLLVISTAALYAVSLLERLRHDRRRSSRLHPAAWIVTAAGMVGLTAWLTLHHHNPGENLLGNHDQGMYLSAGLHLARTGSFQIDLPDLAALEPEEKAVLLKRRDVQFMRDADLTRTLPLCYAIGLPLADQTAALGPAIPHFPAGFALSIAAATAFGGQPAALHLPAFAILGGILALGVFTLRQFGTVPGLLILPLSAAHPLLIWAANRHYSEPLLFLLFALAAAALCWLPRYPRLAGSAATLLLAVSLLVKIDALVLLPAFVLALFIAQPPRQAWWAIVITGAIAGPAAGGFLAVQSGTYYASNLTALFQEPVFAGAGLLGLALAIGLGLIARRHMTQWVRYGWWTALAAAALLLFWLIVVRPGPTQADSYFNPATSKTIRSFREDTLPRLDWYWIPGGLLLTAAAAVLTTWKRRGTALVFLATVGFACLVLLGFDLRCDPIQPVCMRRLLPFALPLLLVGLCGSWACFRHRVPRTLVIVATLAIGWGELAAYRSLQDVPEYAGLSGFVERLAAALPPDSVVLFSERTSLAAFAVPLRTIWNRASWVVALDKNDAPAAAALRRAIQQWQRCGLRVFIAGTNEPDPFRLGLPLQPVFDERLTTRLSPGSYTAPAGPVRTVDWRCQVGELEAPSPARPDK